MLPVARRGNAMQSIGRAGLCRSFLMYGKQAGSLRQLHTKGAYLLTNANKMARCKNPAIAASRLLEDGGKDPKRCKVPTNCDIRVPNLGPRLIGKHRAPW